METAQLVQNIKHKKSFLCLGLDTDIQKIPPHLWATEDPIFEFNKAILEATHQQIVAVKPNLAFYEALGIKGWQSLEKTMQFCRTHYPDLFTIADAKRGDIGNTAGMYAAAFFDDLQFDSVTVAPYMGKDSVTPFLQHTSKHTILLALTSNEGAFDFQTQLIDGVPLYQKVIATSQTWEHANQLMYVVGATKSSYFKEIRQTIPHSFLLVPGVGAQGGSLEDVCQFGLNEQIGLLVNSSRGIIYASSGEDFAQKAQEEALKLQLQMQKILEERHLL